MLGGGHRVKIFFSGLSRFSRVILVNLPLTILHCTRTKVTTRSRAPDLQPRSSSGRVTKNNSPLNTNNSLYFFTLVPPSFPSAVHCAHPKTPRRARARARLDRDLFVGKLLSISASRARRQRPLPCHFIGADAEGRADIQRILDSPAGNLNSRITEVDVPCL